MLHLKVGSFDRQAPAASALNARIYPVCGITEDELRVNNHTTFTTFVFLMTDITIFVENTDGTRNPLRAPTDMGLSLMEFLKANEHEILATCGGIALCATCHVSIIKGNENLTEISNDEYAMLDTLPNITETSRLSCQIKLNSQIDGLIIKIMGDGN